MSTEYDRSVHSDKSTEDVASGSQVGEPSTWQESRDPAEKDSAATETPEDATAVEYGARQGDADYETAPTSDSDLDRHSDVATEHDATTGLDQHTTQAEEHAHGAESDAAAASGTAPDEVTAVPGGTGSTEATTSNDGAPQRTSLDDVGTPLFAETDLDRLRTQWREVQGNFVDNPRDAVTQADKIVADVIYQLTTAYAERKRVLEQHCAGVQDADTEDLRQALRGYRGFFRRLLVLES